MKKIVVEEPLGEDVILISHKDLVTISDGCIKTSDGKDLVDTRNSLDSSNKLNHKSIWLNPDYNWVIGEDSVGMMVLVPTRKVKK